jgi:EAL and modified HD-GYP domain-containing signal transduction protein
MVNSSTVRSSKINNLKHAAAMLGQTEIKKWVTTAVTSSLGQESPGEITRLSMLRAKFCENIADLFEMAIDRDNLFLMGLFSVLDVVLDMTMEKALHLVYVPEDVAEALLGKENHYATVYQFVRLYEHGDWQEVSRIALMNNMSISSIAQAYHDALHWYGQIINMPTDTEEFNEPQGQ